ncbi:Uncharacterised protein [Salmonella enterica subsp. houtenae]|nr:Uncharacterised protein [Salmonella enterica subsp. houtenae]
MSLLNRIKSHLVKSTLNKNGKGIYIDFLLYVDEKSTFEGYNRITGKSSIYNSHIGSYTYAVGPASEMLRWVNSVVLLWELRLVD